MPIGFSPADVFPGILCSLDEHVEESQRLRLTLRAISVAERRQMSRLLLEASQQTSAEEENGRLNQAIKLPLVGWSNCMNPDGEPIAFSDEALDAVFSTHQKYELAKECPSLLFTAELQKKALRLSQRSGAKSFAKDAAAGAATTSPTPTTP